VIIALFALGVLLSGCGGSNSNAQPERPTLLGPHKSAPPSVIPKVVPPRLLQERLRNNGQQSDLLCTSRLFAEGRGATTIVKTCFLSVSHSEVKPTASSLHRYSERDGSQLTISPVP
jgi:hypothetical protein